MNLKVKTALVALLALLCISFAVIESRQEQLQKQLDLFSEFYTLLDKNYVDTLNLPYLMKRSMRKTLGELDPYSNYYDAEETQNRGKAWQGILYAGIGSTVKQTDSGVVIVEPTTGLPAWKEGLRAGDLILEINDTNVQKLPLDSVVTRLKGNEGEALQLTLRRPHHGVMHKLLIRQNITSRPVPLYYMDTDRVGYILFSHFLAGSSKALKSAVLDLKLKGMKKLVLDMRGNNGGLVEECASALGIFFPPNTLVCSLRLKDSTANYSYKTTDAPVDTLMPIVILTDRHTISSGEIFAGCMKDHHRALLIGDRTYGKGFVQGTRFFKNGQSLYVTVARYYTPAGNFIGYKGVAPDIEYLKTDTVPPHLQAILNSGIIWDYAVQYRNTKPDNEPFNNHIEFNNFRTFYLARLSKITFPEEAYLASLAAYPSAKGLKAEIQKSKTEALTLYKKELEKEIKKQILTDYYQYTQAGQISFEQSGIYRFIHNR